MRFSTPCSRKRPLRLLGLSVTLLILPSCLLGSSPSREDGQGRVTQANYELAGRFTANELRSMFVDTTVHPVWTDNGRRFWYVLRDGTAMRFFLVDVEERSKTELEVRLILLGPNLVEFTIAGRLYRFDTVSQELTRIYPDRPSYEPWQTPSPDGSMIAYAKNHNLVVMRIGNPGEERQITRDAEVFYSFAEPSDFYFTEEAARACDSLRTAQVFWSPDSKKLVATRRDVRHYRDQWVINSLGAASPELTTYKQRFPGDDPPQSEVWIYDSGRDSLIEIRADKWAPSIYEDIVWSRDSQRLYMVRKSPDRMQCDLLVVDGTTGEFTVLISENTGALALSRPVIELADGGGFLWWSRRDGYGRYYLYDSDGSLKNQVTTGEFMTAEILGVDEDSRSVYLMANGRERGRNPYYEHLYRANLAGKGMELLTWDNAHHQVSLSPSRGCFVDSYSRVDMPPVAELRDIQGNLLMELERAEISTLVGAGWKEPEIIKAKAADGKTDLWGVMWKPYDFDPDLKYPTIAFVYPGPQDELVPLAFVNALDNNAHLAQYGFIVVHFGNRGGSYKRPLAYSEYYRGRLRDYPVEDTKAVIEQLADRYDYVDIDRVGIWGGSSGAYAAVTSMLTYPDFYKVCVARSGPHVPGIYHAWWSDQFQGMSRIPSGEDAFAWVTEQADGNPEIAGNLKGRLLLIHSEMDQNVHPAHSARMARALMAANKRFDYFVVPGAGHGWGPNWTYVQRMMWTYFVNHLMGDKRWDVDIFEDFQD